MFYYKIILLILIIYKFLLNCNLALYVNLSQSSDFDLALKFNIFYWIYDTQVYWIISLVFSGHFTFYYILRYFYIFMNLFVNNDYYILDICICISLLLHFRIHDI